MISPKVLISNITYFGGRRHLAPGTKVGKNCVKPTTDFDTRIAKLQNDKTMLEKRLFKTVAHIEDLKNNIKSLSEGTKPQKAEIKQTEKEVARLEAKKVAAEAVVCDGRRPLSRLLPEVR